MSENYKNKMWRIVVFSAFLIYSNQISFSQSWNPLSSGMNNWVQCFAEDTTNNLLYAGGRFTQSGGNNSSRIARWNGTEWNQVGIGADSTILTISVIDDIVYAGGYFSNIGGVPANRVAKFDGTNWSAMDSGLFYLVFQITEYNDEIYAAYAGGLSKWNGTTWIPITSGGVQQSIVTKMKEYNGELYITGSFTVNGEQDVTFAKWNGTQLTKVATYGVLGGGYIYAMEVFNNELYVGGAFYGMDTVVSKNIAKWNGTNWLAVSALSNSVNSSIQAFKSLDNDLYIGGVFNSIGGTAAKNIARFDGSNYFSLNSGADNAVLSLCEFNGNLVVGGKFIQAGSINGNFVAEWTEPLGINELSQNNIKIYPNPNKGIFTIQLDESITGIVQCEILDLSGKKVSSQEKLISNGNIDFNGKLEGGVYFIRINDFAKGQDYFGKIVVE